MVSKCFVTHLVFAQFEKQINHCWIFWSALVHHLTKDEYVQIVAKWATSDCGWLQPRTKYRSIFPMHHRTGNIVLGVMIVLFVAFLFSKMSFFFFCMCYCVMWCDEVLEVCHVDLDICNVNDSDNLFWSKLCSQFREWLWLRVAYLEVLEQYHFSFLLHNSKVRFFFVEYPQLLTVWTELKVHWSINVLCWNVLKEVGVRTRSIVGIEFVAFNDVFWIKILCCGVEDAIVATTNIR